MFSDEIRIKLENIVKGVVIEEHGDTCTTIRNLLCTSFRTSTTVKKDFEGKSIIKEKQVEFLNQLANKYNWWVQNLPGKDKYLAEGGEARVYLHSDNKSVILTSIQLLQTLRNEVTSNFVNHETIFTTAYFYP